MSILHLAIDWLQESPAGIKKVRKRTEYPDRVILANQTCYFSARNSNPHFFQLQENRHSCCTTEIDASLQDEYNGTVGWLNWVL